MLTNNFNATINGIFETNGSSMADCKRNSLSQVADNIVSCTNTSKFRVFHHNKNVEAENKIDVKWSSNLSNEGMLDFIWCPHVNLKKLFSSLSGSDFFPESGDSVIFMHSNGHNLFIKNKKISLKLFSNHITKLDGYYNSNNCSPLILAACMAGHGGPNSIAQKLSNRLERAITASPGMIYAYTNDDRTHITKICSDNPFLTFFPLSSTKDYHHIDKNTP